ncbi:aminotransferase class V-fold PLP-dependent enzyme [Paenibacillus mesophilus]|uniref:aminotransferase class V-fold PLP-dependent enzyme n=1 Tax=Paenibacillus mesophilus TaxID=2582849 RepID=UPI00110DEBE2|nr:aminotransferase class V-fold PLP-dependent enzyme [Paenibacillus mesophilus]TMV46233.1 aminotransferase class V-fold PLP-dependent enzyme [Paenibacillus mesophilus]
MSSFYGKLGVTTVINAADSYTMIGGSLMPVEVTDAMAEAGRHFVSLEQLHLKAGEQIARLTRNEAAVITSGAAAALSVATAACMTGADTEKAREWPLHNGAKNEVVMHRCQRNGFDIAIRQTGATLVEIGDTAGTTAAQLEAALGDRTACIIYFDTPQYTQGALALEEVIRISGRKGIPVVVDAAAQLPPVSNLWRYTEMGADLVIFSGGKTLRGPQSSGFIVGKEHYVAACRLYTGARNSIARPMKVGKEEIAGLVAAIERYVNLDHEAMNEHYERLVDRLRTGLNEAGWNAERAYPGPTGQDYPLVHVKLNRPAAVAEQLSRQLLEGTPSILVALSPDKRSLVLNPLHLQEDEVEQILSRMRALYGWISQL